jgi:hypothetical protein
MKELTPEQEKNLHEFQLMSKIADLMCELCFSMNVNPDDEAMHNYLVAIVNKRMTADFSKRPF